MADLFNIILSSNFLMFLIIAAVLVAIAGLFAFVSDKVAGTKFGERVVDKFTNIINSEEETQK